MADASAIATLARYTEPSTPDRPVLCLGSGPGGRAGIGSPGVDALTEPAKSREGQRCHVIVPPAQCGPDQAVGLRVSAAPPAFSQVDPDPPGGGCIELAVDIGLNLGTQS